MSFKVADVVRLKTGGLRLRLQVLTLVKSVPVHRLEGEECATGEAQPLVLLTPSNAIGAPLRLPGAPINV